MTLPIVLGRTISNEVYIDDLASLPHLLIAGATGSGKSVGINVIITSLLYSCGPDKVKFLLIDPKRVELFNYQHLKSHFLVKFPDIDEQIITDPQKAIYALKCVEKEMDMRYITLQEAGMRNIGDYNKALPKEAMPYIVVVIDELADLMITAGREVEEPITRLAQLARAIGIHLILATQRPSVDVITGIIKANFPHALRSRYPAGLIPVPFLTVQVPKNSFVTATCSTIRQRFPSQSAFRDPMFLPKRWRR